MHCTHCGFVNGDDDHRCLRCGRRLSGVAVAAPAGYSGANALAPALVFNDETQEFEPVKQPEARQSQPKQPMLFTAQMAAPAQNVIPFDRRARQQQTTRPLQSPNPDKAAPAGPATDPGQAETAQGARGRKAPAQSFTHGTAHATATQETLDFVPAGLGKGRRLKTDVDAQIFCDQAVATPTHRFVASAIDGALILIGFGVLAGTYVGLGGAFGQGKGFWIGIAAAFLLVSMFYGLLWAVAGVETLGMRATDLQLITFDGFQLDARSRALRFASTWLSFCSGGLGLLWAIADEESLTWHDHISKTFPAIREATGSFVKQRG